MATGESYVGVAPDGTGKKVRNLSIDAVQADGTLVTVQMQVVAIRDLHGDSLDFRRTNDLLEAILQEAIVVRRVLSRLAGDAEATLVDNSTTIVADASNTRR